VPPSQAEIAVAGSRETVSLTVPPRLDRLEIRIGIVYIPLGIAQVGKFRLPWPHSMLGDGAGKL
jgi:hypothetical protein